MINAPRSVLIIRAQLNGYRSVLPADDQCGAGCVDHPGPTEGTRVDMARDQRAGF
jgi:hypothetical protein